MADIRNQASLEVPMHLRNAPTTLMKDLENLIPQFHAKYQKVL